MLPPRNDHRWRAIVLGEFSPKPTSLALQMIVTRLTKSAHVDPSAQNVETRVAELYTFALKFPQTFTGDLGEYLRR